MLINIFNLNDYSFVFLFEFFFKHFIWNHTSQTNSDRDPTQVEDVISLVTILMMEMKRIIKLFKGKQTQKRIKLPIKS